MKNTSMIAYGRTMLVLLMMWVGFKMKSQQVLDVNIMDTTENDDSSFAIDIVFPESGKPAPCCLHGEYSTVAHTL